MGYQKEGYVVDHINHDRLDNRRPNLRICTQKENSYNRSRIDGKLKGVRKLKTSYSATISKDGMTHTIGGFKTEQDAAKMYDQMAEELFGEFAGKNYKD